MTKNIFMALVACMMVVGVGSCEVQKKPSAKAEPQRKEFHPPTPPLQMTDQQQIANFVATNYWQNFDFSDTAVIDKAEFTEQIFVNYISAIQSIEPSVAAIGVKEMMKKAVATNTKMGNYFYRLCEKYFGDLNSPNRNEDLFIAALQEYTQAPNVESTDKVRPLYLLELVSKNRVGMVASDFSYTTNKAEQGRLSQIRTDYTIIFFNNPDCHDCKRVKKLMDASPSLLSLLYNPIANRPTVTLLALYPDEDIELWKRENYNHKWVNAYDPGQTIRQNKIYDLRAIPTLFLLDKDKKVILKDAPFEQIDHWLFYNILHK
jgi:thioredoxin-related protein